jgi:hypothetical protein|tara:strand:+ start:6080 stop:6199 length:120 start_codon:yes stop_codon:yes gene_type:complete
MDAIFAGLTAWGLEITIVAALLLLLRHEENKVFKRRQKK